jgi:outer membrane protein assembly factor BamB
MRPSAICIKQYKWCRGDDLIAGIAGMPFIVTSAQGCSRSAIHECRSLIGWDLMTRHIITIALVVFAGLGSIWPQVAGGVRMITSEGVGAQYWPRWRGPSGQGLVTGTGYPDTWSATANIRWKTPVPGRGNSSPIVWADRIFITTAYDGGRRLSLIAYRRSDGVKLWETFVPDGRSQSAHTKNGHASSTPATDGERVYAYFGTRGLVAFDLNGGIAWRQDLGQIDAYHGTAGSPLLYRDRIILYQDQYNGSFIGAFDTRTGRQLWRTRREASVGWGAPIAIRVGNRDEIIVNGQSQVQAYAPEDGRELWRCRGTTYEVIPTPVVGFGMVFCSSGRAGPTMAIRPGGENDVTRSHVVWTSPRGSPFVPSPILYGDYLYIVNDMSSIVTSLEATSGRTMWQGRLGVAAREGFSASPVAVDGKVFFTNDDGETFVLRAGPTFELLHVNRIGEPTLASPALVDRHWYIRTAGHLVAIGD